MLVHMARKLAWPLENIAVVGMEVDSGAVSTAHQIGFGDFNTIRKLQKMAQVEKKMLIEAVFDVLTTDRAMELLPWGFVARPSHVPVE